MARYREAEKVAARTLKMSGKLSITTALASYRNTRCCRNKYSWVKQVVGFNPRPDVLNFDFDDCVLDVYK
jgi:hypothetical protein